MVVAGDGRDGGARRQMDQDRLGAAGGRTLAQMAIGVVFPGQDLGGGSAKLWNPWAPATDVTTTPAGRWTTTGTLLLVVVPSPRWPDPSYPQASTSPAEVRARLWPSAPAIEVTVVPTGTWAGTGSLRLTVVPSPS